MSTKEMLLLVPQKEGERALDGNRMEHVQSAKSLGVIINHHGKVDSVVVVELQLSSSAHSVTNSLKEASAPQNLRP